MSFVLLSSTEIKKSGIAVRIHFHGNFYGVEIYGNTLSLFPEIEDITKNTIYDATRIFRSDGSGKSVSIAIKKKVVEEISKLLK